MPELPEVQTVVDGLRDHGLIGRRIMDVEVRCSAIVAEPSLPAFRRWIRRKRIQGVSRRGKYIVIALSGNAALLIHLRMTGRFRVIGERPGFDRHNHVILRLDDGRFLVYHDTRKFGRWILTRDSAAVLGHLGPEPLAPDFSLKLFLSMLKSHRRMLKPLLLDQHFLAGLGNIYVDEALWVARLHPRLCAATLTEREIRRLYFAIRRVLTRSLRAGGTSLGDGDGNFSGVSGRRGRNQLALRVFGRSGKQCLRCSARIVKLTVAQRGTYICPRCQRLQEDESRFCV